jgi:hypothetical protein
MVIDVKTGSTNISKALDQMELIEKDYEIGQERSTP